MSFTVAASIGNMPNASGAGSNGPHIVYATNNNTFWVFWLSSTQTMNAAYWNGSAWTSPSSGATFTLPAAHSSEGRGFTVVAQAIGANDVFYVGFAAQSTSSGTVDVIRVQVSATSLTWGTASSPGNTGGGGNTPITVAVALDSNNKPWMGWQESGDSHGAQATNADSGTSWTSAWGTDTTILSAANQVYNRQMLPGASGYVLDICDPGGASSGTTTNSGVDGKYGNAPGSAGSFFTGVSYELGDMCGVRLDTSNYAIFARNGTTSYVGETASVSANVLGSWSALPSLPSLNAHGGAFPAFPAAASGLALCSDGSSKLYLFLISGDSANQVMYCVLTKGASWAGGSWGSWTSLESSTQTRNSLSGCQATDGTSVWVLWTETVSAGSQYSVVSGKLSLGGGSVNGSATLLGSAGILGGLAGLAGLLGGFAGSAGVAGGLSGRGAVGGGLAGNGSVTAQSASLNSATAQGTGALGGGLAGNGSLSAQSAALGSAILQGMGAIWNGLSGQGIIPAVAGSLGGAIHGAATLLGMGAMLLGFGGHGDASASSAATPSETMTGSGTLGDGLAGAGAVNASSAASTPATLSGTGSLGGGLSGTGLASAKSAATPSLSFLGAGAFLAGLFGGSGILPSPSGTVTGAVVGIWRWAYSATKALLNAAFGTKPQLKMVYAATQSIVLSFTRESPVANPNTTIQVTMTATDSSGNPISNLATVTCTVTFPDGSTSNFSLGSGITNAGSGKYTLVYTTKGQGENLEDWVGIDGAGNRAEYHNETPVSF